MTNIKNKLQKIELYWFAFAIGVILAGTYIKIYIMIWNTWQHSPRILALSIVLFNLTWNIMFIICIRWVQESFKAGKVIPPFKPKINKKKGS